MSRLLQHVSFHWILDLWFEKVVFSFIFVRGISFLNFWVYTCFLLAERPYLATLKLWWCVVIVRQFYVSLLVVELDSLKDVLSGKRVTNLMAMIGRRVLYVPFWLSLSCVKIS